MILPNNDFARRGSGKMMCGQNDSEFAQAALNPAVCSANVPVVARCPVVFLAEPQPTAYDLRFSVLGFPVRVAPWFWLVALVLGWDLATGVHEHFAQVERDRARHIAELESAGQTEQAEAVRRTPAVTSPGAGVLIVVWVAAVFTTILVHELGHALVMRYYGMGASIVLYHFGGMAIPNGGSSFGSFGQSYSRLRPTHQIAISAAGPGAQLLLVAVVILCLRLAGYSLSFSPSDSFGYVFGYSLWPLDSLLDRIGGRPMPSLPSYLALFFLLTPSIYWALLNLVPVYPLDGGQISREVFTMSDPQSGIRNSLILSIAAGVAVAVYALSQGDTFLAIMFGMLAFSSYQILQAYSGRGGGFGPW
jgi:Zn-dependent protease